MIKKNIVANLFGRAWGVLSVYLFVPMYLRLLGGEAYGLVGFYTTLLSVLAFADMGLTATLNREMARLSVCKGVDRYRCDLLRTYETAYAGISVFISVIVWCLAPLIAERWLRFEVLKPTEVCTAIRIMGVSVAIQLPALLYTGGLMGMQRQVLVNCLQIGWGLTRGVGAVIALWLVAPTIIVFAWSQLLSNVLFLLAARMSLWRTVKFGSVRPQVRWTVMHDTWSYAAGMAGLALISSLLLQTDKLAVSRMLPLEMFGYYMIAVAVASVPKILASPIGAAVFPELTALVSTGDRKSLIGLYHRAASLVSVAVIPTGVILALFSGDVILAWTGNVAASHQGGLAAAFLVCGETMQAITVVPFYLVLANGNLRINIVLGITSVVLVTPLLLLLIARFGVAGAGLSWLVLNVCTLLPYMYCVHRCFAAGEGKKWCMRDVLPPAVTGGSIALLGRWMIPETGSLALKCGYIIAIWVAATAGAVLSSVEVRQDVFLRIRVGSAS